MKGVTVLLVGLVFGAVAAQEPAEVRAVRAFAKQMGIPISGKYTLREAAGPRDRPELKVLMIDFGQHGFFVRPGTRQVTMYNHHERFRQMPTRPDLAKPKFATEKDWWAHGEAYLRRAKLPYPMRPGRFNEVLTPSGTNAHTVYLTFEHQPYGISTGGNGNIANFGFDRFTGELRSCMFRLGSTIMPPTIKISERRAIEIATARLKGTYPTLVTKVYQVHKQYHLPNDFLASKQAKEFLKAKKVVYSYCVQFNQAFVFVHAESGEIMGGGSRKAPMSPRRKE